MPNEDQTLRDLAIVNCAIGRMIEQNQCCGVPMATVGPTTAIIDAELKITAVWMELGCSLYGHQKQVMGISAPASANHDLEMMRGILKGMLKGVGGEVGEGEMNISTFSLKGEQERAREKRARHGRN